MAIEACREAWYVYDPLTSWGNQVLLVDTTRSKQLGVGRHGRKTDRIDAEVLARAVEEGRIPLAHVLTPERRELRKLLNVRRYLVEARAQGVTKPSRVRFETYGTRTGELYAYQTRGPQGPPPSRPIKPEIGSGRRQPSRVDALFPAGIQLS